MKQDGPRSGMLGVGKGTREGGGARGDSTRLTIRLGRGRGLGGARAVRAAEHDAFVGPREVAVRVRPGRVVVRDGDAPDERRERAVAVVRGAAGPRDGPRRVAGVPPRPGPQLHAHGRLRVVCAVQGRRVAEGPDRRAVDLPGERLLRPDEGVVVEVGLSVRHGNICLAVVCPASSVSDGPIDSFLPVRGGLSGTYVVLPLPK